MGGALNDVVALFAGEHAADPGAVIRATQMERAGVTPDKIFAATGMFRGANKKWRTEIDDSGAALTGRSGPTLGAALDHPKLYEVYPALKEMQADITRRAQIGVPDSGRYDGKISARVDDEKARLEMALHEVQHAIQHREGWPIGTTPEAAGYDAYSQHPGEVEARAAAERRGLTAEQRKLLLPIIGN